MRASFANPLQIHIVKFDTERKIQQIRQNWDQGSLLKLIDVIGKTGRNWPIYAGKDQIRLIAASVKAAGNPVDEEPTEDGTYTRSRGSSQNVTRDPHASLALFAPREKTVPDYIPVAATPRSMSAKPPPRDYNELFVGNELDELPESPSKGAKEYAPSPSKPAVIAAKAGSGKNYAPSRLFDTEEETAPSGGKDHSAEHFYRPNPAKYQHFDFGDGTEEEDAPKPPKEVKKSKHGSQWNFEDFATPQKVTSTKVLPNDVRHWGNENDEVADSPIKQKQVAKARKDAQSNFEFKDDGSPGGNRVVGRPRGAGQNTGLGLYRNNVYDEEGHGEAGGEGFKRSDTVANVKDRSKDFDPHFTMTDDSPAPKQAPEHISEDRAKAVKMMDANWSASYDDESPTQKENVPSVASKSNAGASKTPLSESTNTATKRNDGHHKIVTAGDGMGGRKGAGRQWGFGDESDGEEAGGLNQPGKVRPGKYGGNRPTGGDFWDF